jgi:hypothetical protein
MTWFCYWSPKKEAEWQITMASERPSLAASGAAEFISALDLDRNLSDKDADPSGVRYLGDFYVDFDSEDLGETTARFNEFLGGLKERYDADPNLFRLFASGKKGYHVEIPARVFIEKPSPSGYEALPLIYHDMAEALYVDTLDLCVYSGRKGRMWRVPNVRRPDTGTYKVRITLDEARTMTPARYAKIVANPRALLPAVEPAYAPRLAVLWATSQEAVKRRFKAVAKRRSEDLLERYEGKIPESLLALMNGEGIKEGTGFNQIAQQLAVAARGFKLSSEDFLARCQGLIDKHVGDGTRYAAASKRRQELLHMWHYMQDNPSYVFSVPALRSLCDHPAEDLNGKAVVIKCNPAITLGMSVDRHGIYKLVDGENVPISEVGFAHPTPLLNLASYLTTHMGYSGYDVDVYFKGEFKNRCRLSNRHFSSNARFRAVILDMFSETCQITDAQVNALVSVFHRLADAEGTQVTYMVNHEGLDIVTLPDGRRDILWVDAHGVYSRLGESYVFAAGVYGGSDFPFKVDLMTAPCLPPLSGKRREGTPYLDAKGLRHLKRDLDNLLSFTEEGTLAKTLGWTIACFLCPALRLTHDQQFPLLHLYGLAGSGKSTTMRILTRFHGHQKRPGLISAGSVTPAGLVSTTTGTNSLPQIIDEFKPAELSTRTIDSLTMTLRNVFDATETRRGRVSREQADSQVVTPSFAQTAPTAFLSEHLEGDTAILQRSIVVPFSARNRGKNPQAIEELAGEGRENLFGSVGRAIVEHLIYSDDASPEVIHSWVMDFEKQLRKVISGDYSERPRYGIAVAVTGLHLLLEVLTLYFGDEFSSRIEALKQALLVPPLRAGQKSILVHHTETNIVKVLSTLSEMSAEKEGVEDYRLVLGKDYAPFADGIEINTFTCFLKYRLVMKRVGERLHYPSSSSFIAALDQYPGVAPVATPSVEGMRNVYRLDAHQMYEVDGINPFVI